jgi:hypothetical protein
MIVSDGLIIWKCHSCEETSLTIGFDLGSHYMWANQHGKQVRFFCHKCGDVYDVTELKGELSVKKHTMKCVVRGKYKVVPRQMKLERSWTRQEYEAVYRSMRRGYAYEDILKNFSQPREVINAADYSYQAKDYDFHGWLNTDRMNEFVYKLTNVFYQRGEIPF